MSEYVTYWLTNVSEPHPYLGSLSCLCRQLSLFFNCYAPYFRYQPVDEERLLRAFQVIDKTSRGYLTQGDLVSALTSQGEPFSPDEMEEMVGAAVNSQTGRCYYKDFISNLIEDTEITTDPHK